MPMAEQVSVARARGKTKHRYVSDVCEAGCGGGGGVGVGVGVGGGNSTDRGPDDSDGAVNVLKGLRPVFEGRTDRTCERMVGSRDAGTREDMKKRKRRKMW